MLPSVLKSAWRPVTAKLDINAGRIDSSTSTARLALTVELLLPRSLEEEA